MPGPGVRIGHGYDLHRLEPIEPEGRGRPLVLGGLRFDSDVGPVAHSDGDVLLHALTDAILGALGEPDLGSLFPDDAAEWRDAASSAFLEEAMNRMRARGYALGNADVTILAQRPKIGPRRTELRSHLAHLLAVEPDAINVKGKTGEGLGAVGEGRAIEAHAVAILHATDPRAEGS